MLLTFLCLAAALVLFALVLWAWPLVFTRADDSEKHRVATNIALLKIQFMELEREHAAGTISAEEYEETKAEIEQRVLEESEADTSRGVAATAFNKIIALVGVIVIPVAACSIYMKVGTPQALEPEFARNMEMMAETQGSHTEAELRDQIRQLEERLKENPDNADGWMMLARTSSSIEDWEKATLAFEEVNRLRPNDPDVLADWADVMAANIGGIAGRPEKLVREALKINPNHWKALALMGSLAFSQNDFKSAVMYWERLRQNFDEGSSEWRQITENIDEARKAGGLSESGSMIEVTPKKTEAAKVPAVISGVVTIDDAVKSKAAANDTVFVFARPLSGSKMPVAFLRVTVKDLPYRFTLDDASQMAMGVKTLADVDEVIVEARISHSGNFMAAAGDLEGAAPDTVKVGSQDVKVVINKVRP